MNPQEKKAEVEKLQELFREASHAFLIDFRGLNVVETTELRRKVRAESATYRVVKNRLAILAGEETFFAEMKDLLRGPTAVVSGSGDFLKISRLLRDFSKEHPSLGLKGAWVDGQMISGEGVTRLANLPARPEMIGRFLGVLGAPMSRFCLVLQSPLRGFVTALKEMVRKKS